MISKNTKEYIQNKKDQGLYGLDFSVATHPGITLLDELNFLGFTQKELSKKIGYTVQTVNRIIKGVEPITTEIALALERVFGGHPSAQFWLNMQADYDRKILKQKELENTQEEIVFFKDNMKDTFKELQTGGVFDNYVLNTKDSYKKAIISFKDFFGSYSLRMIPEESLLGIPFRKYNIKNTNQYNLSALLKIGEKKAKQIIIENMVIDYDKKVFINKIETLRKLSNKKQKDFLMLLQKECLNAGVIVVYVPNMKNTGFGGATLWMGNRPVILLKVENQREDIFWFNFFHEMGHVVKHSKKDVFIDFDKNGKKDDLEIKADEFASEMLIPNFYEIMKQMEKGLSVDQWIEIISKKVDVSKSVIAGRLCNVISLDDIWKVLNKFRPVIKEKISFV
ncbi:MAG: HigA family addiction module antitoxin [Patescibacteria group bacterium]|nr:HigA family addiction module antitoxin [Patescibacteria group bacterium]